MIKISGLNLKNSLVLLFFILLLTNFFPGFTRIYKYVDQYGVTHMTNRPVEDKQPGEDYNPVKLREPHFEVRGSWDVTNQTSRVFSRIFDRLHKKRLLDEEEMKALAEQKKKEEEERLKKEAAEKEKNSDDKDLAAKDDKEDNKEGDDKDDTKEAVAPEKVEFIKAWWGLQVKALSGADAKKLNLGDTRGVIITAVYPNSPAASAALAPGQVIVEVRGTGTTSSITDVSSFATQNIIIDQSIQVTVEDPVSEMTNYKTVIIKNIPDQNLANDWY